MTISKQLFKQTATEVVDLLKRGAITPSELVQISIERIEKVDDKINAIPTRCFDRALAHANRLSKKDIDNSLLGGLPIAIKDLTDVAGVRTTYGSPIYTNHVPNKSDIMVERLEANGAIVMGKSNTPEFGAGASTFNEVFGKTCNPWNTDKSVAGSSGGAAAALASGQVWLAQGSDLGGSLRTPASFNSVLGLRPSPGRVPHGPDSVQPFNTMAVSGPMGRTAEDVALMLDAMTGTHPQDPLSFDAPAVSFLESARQREKPKRVAYSPDLGIAPVNGEVKSISEQAAQRFEELGAIVEYACPDFSEAIDSFQVLRAAMFAADHAAHIVEKRDLLKPEVIWNIEKGFALTAEEINRAEAARARLYQNVGEFFTKYDLLLCPTAIVPPFDVDIRYIEEVDGYRFDNYIDWVCIAFAITLTGCPAISAPAGFTENKLPVGVQIVGPHRGEAKVLSAAALLDDLIGYSKLVPVDN